jgi:hypothetical protein
VKRSARTSRLITGARQFQIHMVIRLLRFLWCLRVLDVFIANKSTNHQALFVNLLSSASLIKLHSTLVAFGK